MAWKPEYRRFFHAFFIVRFQRYTEMPIAVKWRQIKKYNVMYQVFTNSETRVSNKCPMEADPIQKTRENPKSHKSRGNQLKVLALSVAMLLSVASAFAQSATLKATEVEQEKGAKGAMGDDLTFTFTEHLPAYAHPSDMSTVTKGLFTIGFDFFILDTGDSYLYISPKSVILAPDQIDLAPNGDPKQYYAKWNFKSSSCSGEWGDIKCHFYFYGRNVKEAYDYDWWTYPALPAGEYAVIVKDYHGVGTPKYHHVGDVHIESKTPKSLPRENDSITLDSGFDGKITVNAQTSEADKKFPLNVYLPDAADVSVFISPDGSFDYNKHVFMRNTGIDTGDFPTKSTIIDEDNELFIHDIWGGTNLFPYVWRGMKMDVESSSLYPANMASWQAVPGVYIYGEAPNQLAHILKPGDYKFTIMYTNMDRSFYMAEFPFTVCHGSDCGTGVGIKELDNIVKLYPNPTSGALTIVDTRHSLSVPEEQGLRIENVEIFDIVGRKVLEERPCPCKQDKMDISHFPAGMYFVRIQTEQGTITQKIVKQ